MALTSPALTLAIEPMFGNIKPVLDGLKKLGFTDFNADAPEYKVAPGATIKVPISSIAAASAFNDSTNNYLTGGDTDWATLSAAHYLQGFDISGVNVDQGVDANKMKQLFTARAGSGIAAAIQGAVKTALDACTQSSAVTLGTIGAQTGAPTLNDYLTLGDSLGWLNKTDSVLAVNGTLLADIKAKLAASNVVAASLTELAGFLGFKDMVLVPGMTARAAIVPAGALGFLGRVPTIIANYRESGVETDADTGVSVGIVIADDQATNKVVANADIWFGVAKISCAAAATTAGIVKIA